jgi:hypothetical protein
MSDNNQLKIDFVKLIDIMLKNGLLLQAQRETIISTHFRHGIDIDILLLKYNLISENTLQNYLQHNYGMESVVDPYSFPEDLAVNCLKEEDAIKYRAIPQTLKDGSISILMVPPYDANAIEELGKLTGNYVVPGIICPLRFKFLLELVYGIKMDNDERALALRVLEGVGPERTLFFKPEIALFDPFSGSLEDMKNKDPINLGKLPFKEQTLSILDDVRQEMEDLLLTELPLFIEENPLLKTKSSSDMNSRTLTGAFNALTSDNMGAALKAVKTRDDLPDIFFGFAARAMRTIAIFSCVENFIMGWTGSGLGLLPQHIEGIIVPEDHGSFLSDLINEDVFMGKVEKTAVNKRIVSLIGGDIEDDIILGCAVMLKERPVLVVAGILDDESLADDEKAVLRELSLSVASTIISLIRKKKSK